MGRPAVELSYLFAQTKWILQAKGYCMRRILRIVAMLSVSLLAVSVVRAEFVVVRDGQAAASIYVDARNSSGKGPEVLTAAAQWLAEAIEQSTGAKPAIAEKLEDRPTIVLARADAQPEAAQAAGHTSQAYDAYAIVAQPHRLYLLGNSEAAVQHAVADLLSSWGFRYFAPSPKWHITPRHKTLAFDGTRHDEPALVTRKIWYAYGHGASDLKPLMANYDRWAAANRLSESNLTQTGHSYGNIIQRNTKEFAEHPEYYALLADGQRDSTRAVVARKFCYSNPGLIELVAADRLRLLEEEQKRNPAMYMVSVDPSDGEGTCHCENCAKLGTTTDRVFHLANEVARRLRQKHPEAWVGLYAYSSHRLPPTITIEPNVYVQVALAFNRTQYTLPELVERWSQKVSAIGLREYYGVEAWDWGLPGRMRGSQVEYHRKWIPFYAARKVNAINAETNSNWGGQTLGHYVAAKMMWNPAADVDVLADEFFRLAFGDAHEPIRKLYARMDQAPALRAATLLPMFEDLQLAWTKTGDAAVRERLVDLMAYLVYASEYRDFELEESRQATHNDAYYHALKPLMQYAYQIRHRDVAHYYALARRLCNGLPLKDGRLDFYLARKEEKPVWMQGEPLCNAEVEQRFQQTIDKLKADKDPTVTFSRYLERVERPGVDSESSTVLSGSQAAVARFRKGLHGYLLATGVQPVKFGLAATGKRAVFTVFVRDDQVLHRQEVSPRQNAKSEEYELDTIAFELPKAGEYRVQIEGDIVLQAPAETPFVFEASTVKPAWIDYSGPHYFYVPRGVSEIFVDANPRLSLVPPGYSKRIDVTPEQRTPGQQYVRISVPKGTDGQVWHTTATTRGQVSLLNIPPLLSFHRHVMLVPREVAEAER